MPKCSICGRELQNPKSSRHINSAYHQNALQKKGISGKQVKPLRKVSKDISFQQEINKLKEIITNIDERVKSLEDLILERNLHYQYSMTDDGVKVIEKSNKAGSRGYKFNFTSKYSFRNGLYCKFYKLF